MRARTALTCLAAAAACSVVRAQAPGPPGPPGPTTLPTPVATPARTTPRRVATQPPDLPPVSPGQCVSQGDCHRIKRCLGSNIECMQGVNLCSTKRAERETQCAGGQNKQCYDTCKKLDEQCDRDDFCTEYSVCFFTLIEGVRKRYFTDTPEYTAAVNKAETDCMDGASSQFVKEFGALDGSECLGYCQREARLDFEDTETYMRLDEQKQKTVVEKKNGATAAGAAAALVAAAAAAHALVV